MYSYLFIQVPTTLLTLHHIGLSAGFQICHTSHMSGSCYTTYIYFLFYFFNTDMFEIFAVLGVGFLPHIHLNSYATSYITFSSNLALLKIPSLSYSLPSYNQLSTHHIMLQVCVYPALRSEAHSPIFKVPAPKVVAITPIETVMK